MTSANGILGTPNWFRFYLDGLKDEHRLEAESLRQILGPVEAALTASIKQANGFTQPQDPAEAEMNQSVMDEECDYIEDLLGIAFVLCQRHITHVVSKAIRLHEYMKEQGKVVKCVDPDRKALMQKASQPIFAGSTVTQVQAIDGFANYFKHRDEWPTQDWSALDKRSKPTADIIREVGAQSGTTGNFRKGATTLGNGQFNDLGVFVDILIKWQENLAQLHESELKILGLI